MEQVQTNLSSPRISDGGGQGANTSAAKTQRKLNKVNQKQTALLSSLKKRKSGRAVKPSQNLSPQQSFQELIVGQPKQHRNKTKKLMETNETNRAGSKLSQNGWALTSQQSGVSAETFLDKTRSIKARGPDPQSIQKLHLGKTIENSDIAGLDPPEDPSGINLQQTLPKTKTTKSSKPFKKAEQEDEQEYGYRLLQRTRSRKNPPQISVEDQMQVIGIVGGSSEINQDGKIELVSSESIQQLGVHLVDQASRFIEKNAADTDSQASLGNPFTKSFIESRQQLANLNKQVHASNTSLTSASLSPLQQSSTSIQALELPQLTMHRKRASMPQTTRNRLQSLNTSPSGRFLTSKQPRAIFTGDYQLTAAIEHAAKVSITQMPAERPSPYTQRTLGLSASRKSLTTTPSVGVMVAGFTKTIPNIPKETRHEQMQELSDIRNNVDKSPLQRPIQIIPPEVHKDASFMVPNLLQHNMGGQFESGTSVSRLNAELTRQQQNDIQLQQEQAKKSFGDRSHSINVLLSKNNQQQAVVHQEAVLAKIDERLEESLQRINQQKGQQQTPKLTREQSFDPFYANYVHTEADGQGQGLINAQSTTFSVPKFVTGLNSYQINAMPVQTTKTGIALQPIKMRLQPLKPRNLSHIPQDENFVYNMMKSKIKIDKVRQRGSEIARNFCAYTDPVDRVKIYRQKDFDEEAERQRRIRWNLIDKDAKDSNTRNSPDVLFMAKSALSNCDSQMDLVNPQRELISQISHKSLSKMMLSPVKLGKPDLETQSQK